MGQHRMVEELCRSAALAGTGAGCQPAMLRAEAALEANGIQDLADQIPEITKAAVGNDLKFKVRIDFGGEKSPDLEAVKKINELLSDVSDSFKLE